MGYLDSSGILSLTDAFLNSIGKKSEVDSARSFFESKMRNLGRSFERGEIKREELGVKISIILKEFKIYLGTTEVITLQKKMD